MTKEPLALIVKGREPEEVVAWACGACGIVARTEAEAGTCCPKRCGCGVELAKHRYECDACRDKRFAAARAKEAEKERAAYEKATKIPYADYDGDYLYCEGYGSGSGGDGYFGDLDDLLDTIDGEQEPPEYAWACSPTKISFDAHDLIESACQESYEDAAGDVGEGAAKELQALLDAWAEKHGPTSYQPDYSRAVDLRAAIAERRGEEPAMEATP